MILPQGAGWCGTQDKHLLCSRLLLFTFFKWLATSNVLLQCSQSVQGISGHAQRGSQISKPKSLVPFDSMRKGPYLWKESPVPTHYRPRASSEPMSHAWGTAPWESRHLGHCRDPGHLRAEEGQQCSLAGPQLPSNVPGVCWAPGTTMHVGLEEAQSWAPGSRALGLKWTTVS